ncbi:hypothetical protein AB5N19_00704 [Seiridium cardinale]
MLRKIKRHSRSYDITFTMVKTGNHPGLLYAESLDLASLTEWAKRIAALQAYSSISWKYVVRPSKSPEKGYQPTMAHGEKLVVVSATTFGKELGKRGLINWWLKDEDSKDGK